MKRRTFMGLVGALLSWPFMWVAKKRRPLPVQPSPGPLDVTRPDAPVDEFTLFYKLTPADLAPGSLLCHVGHVLGCVNADAWYGFPPGAIQLSSIAQIVHCDQDPQLFCTFALAATSETPLNRCLDARWGAEHERIGFTERFGVPREPFPSVKKLKLTTGRKT